MYAVSVLIVTFFEFSERVASKYNFLLQFQKWSVLGFAQEAAHHRPCVEHYCDHLLLSQAGAGHLW